MGVKRGLPAERPLQASESRSGFIPCPVVLPARRHVETPVPSALGSLPGIRVVRLQNHESQNVRAG